MADILATPFPDDFYKAKGWLESLVNFYANQQKKLPVDALTHPMFVLVQSLLDVTYIYGKFPEIVYNSLGQVIDPMFYPEEYREKVYDVLMDAGKKENRPFLVQYAEGLLNLRCMFERDKDFYSKNFSTQIEATPVAAGESKADKFGNIIQEITRIHVNQVRKMIADRK